MRLVSILIILLLMIVPAFAQETEPTDAPYIYYYSSVLKGLVIERADGSDSRLIPLPEDAVLWGPGGGWSPSGKWFSFAGRVLGMDGSYLRDLEEFRCIEMMLWHPTEDTLLVFGTTPPLNGPCGYVDTYWLIDVESPSLLASVSIESYIEEGNPLVYWLNDAIMFYDRRYDFGQDTYLRVTMHYDGRVEIMPVAEAQYRDPLSSNGPDTRGLGQSLDQYNVYPEFTLGWPWNEDIKLPFEPPINSSGAGGVRAWLWDEADDWLLVGYESNFIDSNNVDRVSIYNPTTRAYRELSSCGVAFTCVGWLPEHVSTVDLPDGQSTSVLPTPLYYTYEEREYLGSGIQMGITHRVACEIANGLRNQVQNIETVEIDYVLPIADPCYKLSYDPEVVFAISPDGKYYAITWGFWNDPYTKLHDVETGEVIAHLNFEGIQLSFSDDSSILYTVGRFATAAWSIADLLNEGE